jgi:hypothetical protein
MEASTPKRMRWLWSSILVVLAVLVLAVGLDLAGSRHHRRATELDLSTGRVRAVTVVYGVEFAGTEKDTFVSRSLVGKSLSDHAEWKPLTTYWGLLFGTHGHSSWDNYWKRSSKLEQLWIEGRFTEDARTESARRLLLSFRAGRDGQPNNDYLDLIEQRVGSALKRSSGSVITGVEDLPQPDAKLPIRE